MGNSKLERGTPEYEIWAHAGCLTLAEGNKDYPPIELQSPAMQAVIRVVNERDTLKAQVEKLEDERKKTIEHLQNYRVAEQPNSDTIMVMVVTEANNATSSALWCADLHDLDFALDGIFTGGDPDGLFEDFWSDGGGVDIRFKRVSRAEFDEAMDEDNEWDGF